MNARSLPLVSILALASCAVTTGRGRPDGASGDPDGGFAYRDAGPVPDAYRPPMDSGAPLACSQVDLLFVIDNSPSMRPHQEALAAAFPGFAEAMYTRLPPNVSLHVGITTTSFYTGSCSESVVNCRTAQSPAEVEAHYVRPTDGDTGTNGEQGRLFEHAGRPFFAANTSDADRAPLIEWFTGAAIAAGERGCSYEMPTAAAGYAAHPANAATNGGFLRDDDTVLVVFFLSDEPDKSPESIDAYRSMLLSAKSVCGGEACILMAGLVDTCIADVDNVLWRFMGSFGEAPIWGDIEDAARYGEVVGDALARVVEQSCNEVVLF